ncbi:NPCBM/NEW2 domain-containing protein [Lentzea chajnantorensis]
MNLLWALAAVLVAVAIGILSNWLPKPAKMPTVAVVVALLLFALASVIITTGKDDNHSGKIEPTERPSSSGDLNPTVSTFDNPSGEVGKDAFVSDIEPAGALGNFVDRRAAEIDGRSYAKSVITVCHNPKDESPAVYTLGKSYASLTAVVGVEGKWPFNYSSTVSIKGDGRTLKSLTVGVSRSQSISVDIRNVNRLELHCSFAIEEGKAGGYVIEVAFGDAKIIK